MLTAAVIQPNNNTNNNNEQPPMLTLLDSSSLSSSIKEEEEEIDEEEQKQQILSYLQKSSPTVSSTSYKRVPRLGPYLLLKTLGVGEFGKVKMGRHVETGQTVAVKLVKKENIDSSSQLEKIRMEIDILKTLNHPHIVKLLSVNETTTCIGMVIEFAQGGELFEYIYRQRYLKENEAKRLFSQLISCVYYMHQKNIVHRDLKLENILLDHRGNLIVTDFGFANQFTQITGDLMSTSCGSPVYAAPELVMTGRLYSGTGVDIWSCGIILYAMLCGYLPFDDDIKNPNGDNIGRLYRYIMANPPKYPAHLSHDSKDVIGKMLIPDPAARCKIETIMIHPWLHKYKRQMSKSIQELEFEAQELKQSLLKGISMTEDDYTEDVCCDEDHVSEEEEDICSSRLSSSSCSTNHNSTTQEEEIKDSSSPPTTPIPYSITEKEEEKLSEKSSSHASQKQQHDAALEQHDAMSIPVMLPKIEDNDTKNNHNNNHNNNNNNKENKQLKETSSSKKIAAASSSSSSSSLPKVNKKRHTIDITPIQQEKTLVMDTHKPSHSSSLRAKLFSSVKRKNSDNKSNKRHSWQNIIHRHQEPPQQQLPLSPPSSPTPEQSKSVRLLSWLKNKSPSSHHQQQQSRRGGGGGGGNGGRTTPTSVPSTNESHGEETISIAKPTAGLNTSSAASRTTVLSLLNNNNRIAEEEEEEAEISIESELRIHTGDMNRSALTSKQPMEVLLEINKILLILGIEVQNQGGYKLHCIRRSVHHFDNETMELHDTLNHLSKSYQPTTSLPIYGHTSIDDGQEIQFTVEICRFENLSGLFSVDIQCDEHQNFTGYQFIGQKLLALLHLGNAIRNTNFNVMLSRQDS